MSTNVASVVSHFPDAENGFTTTTSGSTASGAATVGLNSVAGYTNGQPAVFVIEPTSATAKQTFTGIIDTSGVQVTSVVWTAGTNQTHSAGVTVVDYATATHIAMISKGIQVEHNQSGTHGAVTAISLAVSGTTTLTGTFIPKLWDGWISAVDTWTYVSATTFKITGSDVTAKFPVGSKLKMVNSTTKYFYVVSASFSADTTVTVTGGTDYTLANAAITSPTYSYEANPQGFPSAFNYTVTWVGVTATFTSVNRFWVSGRTCTISVLRSTNQTSNATGMTASLPITAATVTNGGWRGIASRVVDNGSASAAMGYAEVISAGTVVNLYPTPQTTNWTAANNKGADFQITYEI